MPPDVERSREDEDVQAAENAPRGLVLAVRLRHDGRVLVEVLEQTPHGPRCVASAEKDHDDHEGITTVLSAWLEQGVPDNAAPSEVRRLAVAFGGWEVRLGDAEYCRLTNTLPYETTFEKLGPSAVASDIGVMFRAARNLAAARVADSTYIAVLEQYLTSLRELVEPEQQLTAYHEVSSGIGGVLDAERYLSVAGDQRVRELLATIDSERADIYQWYMNLAKGGTSRRR